MASGVSLLLDVAATIAIATDGDTGSSTTTYGTPVSINIDSFDVNRSLTTADHSGGQDLDELTRTTKRGGTVEVGFKWGPQGVGAINVANLVIGARVKITAAVALGTGFGNIVEGIITDDSHSFAGPSTGKITIRPYGKALAVSN
jgi:hypothetical protein